MTDLKSTNLLAGNGAASSFHRHPRPQGCDLLQGSQPEIPYSVHRQRAKDRCTVPLTSDKASIAKQRIVWVGLHGFDLKIPMFMGHATLCAQDFIELRILASNVIDKVADACGRQFPKFGAIGSPRGDLLIDAVCWAMSGTISGLSQELRPFELPPTSVQERIKDPSRHNTVH
eukprot:CAMPEP_0204164684 /NCGR_PEP_ID=MMETSP0361-20130328/37499_1 /ASSEMBLY_ACC=CAM_ASM_000343 /TAXON_ID=268821 /ORGANISM="Scrippsiella Hangoei, Strain SHTV-5" /LENGTH=172 /DNA_ID=CAMNT_0051121595 /DNA_START=295 /DNA_END=814 /DNA_ORIENTATION=-